MTVALDVSEHPPSVPEPGLTSEEVVARAASFVPMLVARQAETEQRTFYAADTHEEFRKAGFYRILVPRRYGGYEFGLDTFMRVTMTLARGCPSTGWMYCLGAAHALTAATLFEESAQDELFAGGDFICPATIVPAGTASRVDGGWELDGTWGYCSGAPYATHFIGHTLVSRDGRPPEPMMFIAPRDRWQRMDDWGQTLGLKGSGSHSIRVSGGYIPDHWTLPTHMSQVDVTVGTPGRRLHGNPEYGGGQLSFMVLEDACLAVGMARGALDAYEDLMRVKTTSFPPIVGRTEDPDFQLWYGQAAGLVATAEAATLEAVRQWRATCAEGPAAVSKEQEMRIALICAEAVRLCWRAVEGHLFPTAGSSAVRAGERVERIWRDMSMFRTHAGVAVFLAALAPREFARARFGVDEESGDDRKVRPDDV